MKNSNINKKTKCLCIHILTIIIMKIENIGQHNRTNRPHATTKKFSEKKKIHPTKWRGISFEWLLYSAETPLVSEEAEINQSNDVIGLPRLPAAPARTRRPSVGGKIARLDNWQIETLFFRCDENIKNPIPPCFFTAWLKCLPDGCIFSHD